MNNYIFIYFINSLISLKLCMHFTDMPHKLDSKEQNKRKNSNWLYSATLVSRLFKGKKIAGK